MQRRDLLKLIAAATGVAMIGAPAHGFLLAENSNAETTPTGWSHDDVLLLNEVAETILPTTDTIGAKAAGCGVVMARIVRDCYSEAERAQLKLGLVDLNRRSQQLEQKDFVALSAGQKTALLTELDALSKQPQPHQQAQSDATGYFVMLKQLTIFSFFTSEAASKQVLRYHAVPGKYIGDLPYKKGDKAWAFGG